MNRYWSLVSFLTFLSVLVIGCGNAIEVKEENAAKLCSLATSAFKDQKYDPLYQEIENEFGVKADKIRVNKEGVFVPLKHWFVEEEGIFIARRDMGNGTNSTDPSLKKLSHCIYVYRIKG